MRYSLNIKRFAIFVLIAVYTMVTSGCTQVAQESASKSQSQSTQSSASTQASAEEPVKLDKLTIQAPLGISVSSPMYHILEQHMLDPYANEVKYIPWKSPDELRARLTSEQADISAVPTYVGANLYNRGMDVKMLNVLIWGILYVVGPEGETVDWESLRGQTVYVPMKGDMPDLVFRYLLQKNSLDPAKDLKLEYVSASQELVALLASGKAKYAVIPEHLATMATKKVKGTSKVMNLQEEWAKSTGQPARIPQAGILISGKLVREHPETVAALQQAFKESVSYLKDNPRKGAEEIVKYQDGLTPELITSLIPSLNLQFLSAQEAKAELEFFYKELSVLSPEIIGGKLPDEDFYYKP
ncbi:ABC transporter substrate-binding protein [Paenibacillus kribbensis]|uniref:ABC transporter substrate-binding protein n=1 Tax=Paenibacillus TaxID=44249 RepID=UPI00024EFDE7|nr:MULTISPECIES: ABC transporter substrate-binding protein [Paenibacillus]EHS55944.1 periplasmic component of abc-type transport system [Paenibacillus sp. Aloe-11]MEC0237528.1 ABC transporter substrate-binding protein [Paenibacillus kribbensis]